MLEPQTMVTITIYLAVTNVDMQVMILIIKETNEEVALWIAMSHAVFIMNENTIIALLITTSATNRLEITKACPIKVAVSGLAMQAVTITIV